MPRNRCRPIAARAQKNLMAQVCTATSKINTAPQQKVAEPTSPHRQDIGTPRGELCAIAEHGQTAWQSAIGLSQKRLGGYIPH